MNLPLPQILSGLTLGLILGLSNVLAQSPDNRLLILKTSPEDTVIELTGNLEIREDGHVEATPVNLEACSGSGEPEPADCGEVAVGPPTFRVNNATSATVSEGANVSFSWDSRGAWDCQAGGNLPGWNANNLQPRSGPSGFSFSTANLGSATPYTASLVCSNGPEQSNNGTPQTVSLTVNPASQPIEGCEDRPPPAGWRRLSTGTLSCVYKSGWISSADCREFDGIWSGSIMTVNNISEPIAIRDSSTGRDYVAVRFSTSGLGASERGVISVNTAGGLTSRQKTITISECPGDFHTDLLPSGCSWKMLTGNFSWGGTSSNANCKLQAGREYYLNILYTDSPLGTPPNEIVPQVDCASGSRCGNLYNPSSPR